MKTKFAHIAVLFAAAALVAGCQSVGPRAGLAKNDPEENRDDSLNAIAAGKGRYVAVGGGGTIISSTNGVVWTRQRSEVRETLHGIAYGDGQFVAVGKSGTLLTSRDGIAWAVHDTGANASLLAVAFGNARFVALGTRHTILTSADGVTWNDRSRALHECFAGIAYGNKRFVVIGHKAMLATSPDGDIWKNHSVSAHPSMSGIAFGRGLFVAVGECGSIIASPDGVTWTRQHSDSTARLKGVAFGKAGFVAVGAKGTTLTSLNGLAWNASNWALAKQAGGWGLCHDSNSPEPATVFSSKSDAGYQTLLALIQAGQNYLAQNKRFDMPGFVPHIDWVREMKHYGVLPERVQPEEVRDVYGVEQKYWKSLWHQPSATAASSEARNN